MPWGLLNIPILYTSSLFIILFYSCYSCSERIQSSFNILSVPAAAIALKQGTGRLIRSEADRGILIIGDVRLVRSGYGKKIWQSLPPYTKTLRLERLMQFWNEPDSWQ